MAYRLDFTESNYRARTGRKWGIRLLAVAALGAIVYEVRDAYITYKEPTLDMRLAEYEAVARPIEEMNAAWDLAAKEYAELTRYYRLVWAASPTNFLNAMTSPEATRLGRGFHPTSWTLATGGKCSVETLYVFNPGDKAEQAKGIEAAVVNSITSAVAVADGKVEVKGVQLENLLPVNELGITANFSLPDIREFPAKEATLSDCVKEIVAMRKKVQETRIVAKDGGAKGSPATAQAIMMSYLAIGKDKPDFPAFAGAVNVAGWFDRADQFIVRNRIPGDDAERKALKATWKKIGDARLPWERFRALDNPELVERTKFLATVSDGVRRFKSFLERRHEHFLKMLEPLIETYDRSDVFNRPIIESDLKDHVAKVCGITRAAVTFKDEGGVEPAVLEKADDRFTFTWVRWTLSLGTAVTESGRPDNSAGPVEDDPLTLEKVASVARRAIEFERGYALDSVKIDFGVGGEVTGARLTGLVPVKKVERRKEEKH